MGQVIAEKMAQEMKYNCMYKAKLLRTTKVKVDKDDKGGP